MRYRRLGNTDIKVSVICQGCWSIVPEDFTWGGTPLEDAKAALRASYEAGINFFDTAEMYGQGRSEEILAQALKEVRSSIVIGDKVVPENLAPEQLIAACEASLHRLKTDYIDLYQIHWPNPQVPLEDSMAAMQRLKDQGKIRAIGVSNFGPKYLGMAEYANYPVQSNQVAYNLLFRAAEQEIQPICAQGNISILCYSPLAQGLLTGKFINPDQVPPTRARTRHFSCARPHAKHGQPGFEAETFAAIEQVRKICEQIGKPMAQVALAWLISRPGVASVVNGARSAQQAAANAAAGELQLDESVLHALTAATQRLADKMGPSADMWLCPGRLN